MPNYSLKISPANHFLNWQQDPHGSWQARVVFRDPVDHFSIEVDLLAEMAVINPFDFFVDPDAEDYPFAYQPDAGRRSLRLFRAEPQGQLFGRWSPSTPAKGRTVDFLVDINRRLQQRIDYVIRMETGVMTPEETLAAGTGSCRNSAWLLVQLLRRLGFAARFVSGYSIQLVADVIRRWSERRRAGRHRPPRLGRGLCARRRLDRARRHIGHVRGRGPHPARGDAALPLGHADSGVAEPAEVDFHFDMDVSRIAEAPRITKPFTDARWQALDLGDRVDADLAGDVRLTMGGEPTFIADGDFEAPEWNSAAVGPTKAAYADKLDPHAARELCPRLVAAPWPGQVVSGRKPAALGLFDLLAHGRRSDLARSLADPGELFPRRSRPRRRSTRRWPGAS